MVVLLVVKKRPVVVVKQVQTPGKRICGVKLTPLIGAPSLESRTVRPTGFGNIMLAEAKAELEAERAAGAKAPKKSAAAEKKPKKKVAEFDATPKKKKKKSAA